MVSSAKDRIRNNDLDCDTEMTMAAMSVVLDAEQTTLSVIAPRNRHNSRNFQRATARSCKRSGIGRIN